MPKMRAEMKTAGSALKFLPSNLRMTPRKYSSSAIPTLRVKSSVARM